MKKATLQEIHDLLVHWDECPERLIEEISAELNKGKEKAEANRQAYAELHDKVIECLTVAGNPVSAQEIADEIGASKGKIVYGLTNYWANEVSKDTSGKVTTYFLA